MTVVIFIYKLKAILKRALLCRLRVQKLSDTRSLLQHENYILREAITVVINAFYLDEKRFE